MLTVHHLENSRSQRILWLLEELGLEYEVVRYARHPKTMLAPDALKKIHPLGRSPIITDGANDGVAMAESGAIITYVVEQYDTKGLLLPEAGTPEKLRYTYWMHFAEGSAAPPLVMQLVFSRLSKPPVPFFIRPIGKMMAQAVHVKFLGPRLRNNFDLMEQTLREHTWFAGDTFTAADIQMSFPVEGARETGALSNRPKLKAFLERIHARPAYKRALERGGPYSLTM